MNEIIDKTFAEIQKGLKEKLEKRMQEIEEDYEFALNGWDKSKHDAIYQHLEKIIIPRNEAEQNEWFYHDRLWDHQGMDFYNANIRRGFFLSHLHKASANLIIASNLIADPNVRQDIVKRSKAIYEKIEQGEVMDKVTKSWLKFAGGTFVACLVGVGLAIASPYIGVGILSVTATVMAIGIVVAVVGGFSSILSLALGYGDEKLRLIPQLKERLKNTRAFLSKISLFNSSVEPDKIVTQESKTIAEPTESVKLERTRSLTIAHNLKRKATQETDHVDTVAPTVPPTDKKPQQ